VSGGGLEPPSADAQNGIVAGQRLAFSLVHGLSDPLTTPFCSRREHGILPTGGAPERVGDPAGQPEGFWIWVSATCVDPTHHGAATNIRPARDALTHCPKGHEYTDANNIKAAEGGKKCRTCHNDRRREATARRKANQAA
jgi:hypothetical protein